MTTPSENRRSRQSKAFGLLSLLVIASFVSSPWVLREWHAWRGHKLFLEKQFAEASSHLVHVKDGTTLFATHLNLPPTNYLYAQSLLVMGRDEDAALQYSELAALNPNDGTVALIAALHDWRSGNEAGAVHRLHAHQASSVCQFCKDAHQTFVSAMLAQPKLMAAQHEQEAYLARMKLPAQCILYRGGSAAAGVLLKKVLGFVQGGIRTGFQASGMTKPAIEKAMDIVGPFILKSLSANLKEAVQLSTELEANCGPKLQVHEVLRLKNVPFINAIEQWVEFKTLEGLIDQHFYLGEAKEVLAAGPHLYELGAFAVTYAKVYKNEIDARGLILEAEDLARTRWNAIRLAAQDHDFARRGLALIPPETSWLDAMKAALSTTRSYVWPF